MGVDHRGINHFGEQGVIMRLFISLDTDIIAHKFLGGLLIEFYKKLDFVMNRERNLDFINNYGLEFKSIAIIPTCLDDESWAFHGWKERKLIWRKKQEADIRLRMDYYRFISETPETQRLMFIDIIVKSIQEVQNRSKGDFKGELLIIDILNALDVSMEQLEKLNRTDLS